MKELFAAVLSEQEKKHDLMLVTVTEEAGSAPRGTGAQMLAGPQGRIFGTVGGGPAEKLCEEQAAVWIREKKSGTRAFTLRREDTEDIGSVCGGDITVHFQFIGGEDARWKEIASRVVSAAAERRDAWLVLRTDGGPASVSDADGNALAGEAVSCPLAAGCVLSGGCFSMKIPVGERALIFGGGHIAAALAPLLKTVGFRVTVMDCREEYANRERFPSAEAVICGDYGRLSDSLTLDKNDYVVIMTNGHSFDFEVEAQVLRRETAYTGVIGSKSKTAFVNAKLREAGISEEAVQSVHTPVGVAIKAVTPEEIAVSIAAEMILVRAEKREAAGIETHGCPMH